MALWRGVEPLVLASRSKARRAMLEATAIPIEIVPADIDERAVVSGGAPSDVAAALAWEKARAVAKDRPGRIVLGADQTLAFNEQQLHKPEGRSQAAEQLRMLRGQSHALYSAVAVVRGDKVLFAHVATATLTMRKFSEDFLASYLGTAGHDVMTSVGGYQLEGKGSHLFERVDGDYFTVLGLPLLPLLDFFRREGLLAA